MVIRTTEAAMINIFRDALIAKAEASRRFRSGPSPNVALFLIACAAIAIAVAVGAAI